MMNNIIIKLLIPLYFIGGISMMISYIVLKKDTFKLITSIIFITASIILLIRYVKGRKTKKKHLNNNV